MNEYPYTASSAVSSASGSTRCSGRRVRRRRARGSAETAPASMSRRTRRINTPGARGPPVRAVRRDRDLRAVHVDRVDPVGLGDTVEQPPQRGDAFGADLGEGIHITPGLFEAFGAFGGVVNNPGGKGDAAFDGKAKVGETFAQVVQGTAGFSIFVYFGYPGLDTGIAGFCGDFDFFGDGQVVASDGGGVETI